MERIALDLLGGLRLRQGAQIVQRFRTQKTAALLAFLALSPGQRHPRDELIERFWPDVDPEAGRASLRSALSTLRQTLPDGGALLQADRQYAWLDPERVTTDVAEFVAALGAAGHAPERLTSLERALALYRGPLLPGFYDDWAVRERERLEQRFLAGLRAAAVLLGESGAPERGIEYALRAVAADPLTEENHRVLMRLYAAAGQFPAVQNQLRDLERLLREELRATPDATTRALVDSLLDGHRATRAKDRKTLRQERALPSPYRPASSPAPAPISLRLPLPRSAFFGRESELAHLERWLTPGRSALVTLTGPGGAGKTRLALEAAWRAAERYGGAVWFAPLADIAEPERIPDAILAALAPGLASGGDSLARILSLLPETPGLLILDNVEHLVDEGARFVGELRERAPQLTCLVTSRRRLDLDAEQELPVPPLPVPELPGTPERLEEFPGIQLFAERARAARPGFAITPQSAATIVALCRRLDGIPLGIELAAAWTATLTPRQILERLSAQGDLPESTRRDLSPRHRTVRAAIAGSFRLLPPDLQRFFVRLSVFRGGWSLEAAEAICAQPDAAGAIKQLRDRSLVVAEEVGESMRYWMLETVREYAMEQWDEADRRAIAAAHAAHFLQMAEEAEPHLLGSEVRLWLERLEREQENFRVALHHSPSDPQATPGLRLCAALWRFWQARGHWREGRERLENALRHPRAAEPTPERARALYAAAALMGHLGDYPAARACAEESLTLQRARSDTFGIAEGLHLLGNLTLDVGDVAGATVLYEESLALRRAMGDRRGVASSLLVLGNAALGDDPALAQARYQECLEIRRELGDLRGMAIALNNLGEAARHQRAGEVARRRYEESLALAREVGDRLGISLAVGNLAGATLEQGDLPGARRLNEECLRMRAEMGDRLHLIGSLDDFAQLAIAEGCLERAATLCGAVASLRRSLLLPPAEDHPTTQRVRAALPAQRFAAAWTLGEALSLTEAIAFALEQDVASI